MIWGLLRQLWGSSGATTATPLRAYWSGGAKTRAAWSGGARTRATWSGGALTRSTWSGT